jgi:two-component system cell cycle sensor histidine kinase PleC
MPLPPINTADKFIVDRTKPHRNPDVARAVRKTRDRLSQRAGSPAFDAELLKLHARTVVTSAIAIPLLVIIIAAGGLFIGAPAAILLWAVGAVACYSALAWLARRIDRTETSDVDVAATRRNFLALHFLTGLAWAFFATLGCSPCTISQFPVVKAVVLLLIMAATAIIASAQRGALRVTFALPVVAYALLGADLRTPVEGLMAGLLIASLPFFDYVASHFNRSALMLFSFRTEKDGLIAELETAKALSDEARRRAEEANLAKSRFLASMSHELRTPLNAILGFSEVMATEVLGPMQNRTYRDYARDIHDSGRHLLDLINEILDLSRVEAGRYQLNEEPIALADLVEDCCHLTELKARNKGIRLIQQYEPALPRLTADERALRQITLNLLSNAVKFTPSGGEVTVKVGWTAGGGQYLSIGDNGPGIPADEIPVVLSAFGQGSIAIKSAEQGTGLGLPIVQALVAMHGGEFELRSKLREGTEAIAIFPATRVMEDMPALPTAAAGGRRR